MAMPPCGAKVLYSAVQDSFVFNMKNAGLFRKSLELVRGAGLCCALAITCTVPVNADDALLPQDKTSPDILNLPAATGPQVQDAVFLGAARAGNRILAVGERGIVLISEDGGRVWRQAQVPVQVTLTAVTFAGETTVFAVGHDAVILRSTDSGDTWHVVHSDPELDAPLLDVVFSSEQAGMAVGGRGNLLRTHDGGETWTGTVIYGADDFDGHLFALTRTSGALFVAAEAGAVQRSTDDGKTWQLLETDYTGSFFGLLALRSGRLLAYGMLGNARWSDDLGETWHPVQGDIEASLLTGTELPDGTVVLAGLDGAVAVSTDGGMTFTNASLVERMRISDALPVGDGEWLLLGDQGIQRKTLKVN